ncbi:GDP-mannose 4,6-dehydratase [Alistipes sp.]|uniref:GDP-mannose 4,6-dehydratase n=1 Tax=Alistipes sp. TaxID=1872444 RepID=UPI003AF0D1C0
MQKRIVVLGGVGFIGTHLCLRLLGEGHEVFCVDIRDAANSPLLRNVLQHPSFRYVHHNVINPFAIRCERIYNLTSPSMVRYNKALPVETLKVSVLGAINSLDTARTEHARVLLASAGDIYGSLFRDIASEPAACSTHRILAEGKRAAEALHRAYQEEFGVDTRIARIYNTYGSGAELMDQRVVMKMIVAALQNRDIQINGSGEQMRTFCWVEDIVDGLVRLMEAPPADQTRIINFGSSHEISIRALAEKIIALTGSKSGIVHTEARSDDAPRRTPDISAARRELGWAPHTPLTEGLRRTISYAEKELADKAYAGMTWAEMN